MDIQIIRNASPAAKPADEGKLGFGRIFTDHMFTMEWDREKGWHDAKSSRSATCPSIPPLRCCTTAPRFLRA